MTWTKMGPWIPVAIYVIVSILIVTFAFIPFNKTARDRTAAIEALTERLEHNRSVFADLPARQSERDSLVVELEAFRAALHRTDEVDEVMQAFKRRAKEAGVKFWTLDPSVPAMVSMEHSKDSVAALDLALLPLHFECYGTFVRVGQFLEAEQMRAEFCQWSRLAISPGKDPKKIRAIGDIVLFLLPEENFVESAS